MTLGSTKPLTEMGTRNVSLGVKVGGGLYRAENLTAFMCRLSGKLGASTSWNPSAPVQGLIYILLSSLYYTSYV